MAIEDNPATHFFSSHCFEHVHTDAMTHIFAEMTRVAVDQAQVEIWSPYVFTSRWDSPGARQFLSEEIYYPVCCGAQEAWGNTFGGKWFNNEIRYHCDASTIESLEEMVFTADFAINHLVNIVK